MPLRRHLLPALFFASLVGFAQRPVNAQLFVTTATTNTIYTFDASGNATTFASGGLLSGPRGIAFDTLGRVYIANFTARNILRFNADGTGGNVFASAGLSGGPNDLAFDAAGNLYVANAFDGTIQRFSASGASLGTFGPVVPGARGLDFDAFGNLFVSSYTTNATPELDSVYRIDPLGNATTFVTNASGIVGPREITFAADNTLYVVNNTAQSVAHYSSNGTLLGSLPAGNPQGLAIGPDGTVYIANQSSTNTIVRYNAATGLLTPWLLPNNQAAFGASFAPRVVPLATAAPEPGTIALLAPLPLIGLAALRRRTSKSSS
jgi:DNA-binding beta-propeller fold protein YncE